MKIIFMMFLLLFAVLTFVLALGRQGIAQIIVNAIFGVLLAALALNLFQLKNRSKDE